MRPDRGHAGCCPRSRTGWARTSGPLARALLAAIFPGPSAQCGLCRHGRHFRQAPLQSPPQFPTSGSTSAFSVCGCGLQEGGALCAHTCTSSEPSPASPGHSLHAGQDPAGFCLALVSLATRPTGSCAASTPSCSRVAQSLAPPLPDFPTFLPLPSWRTRPSRAAPSAPWQ